MGIEQNVEDIELKIEETPATDAVSRQRSQSAPEMAQATDVANLLPGTTSRHQTDPVGVAEKKNVRLSREYDLQTAVTSPTAKIKSILKRPRSNDGRGSTVSKSSSSSPKSSAASSPKTRVCQLPENPTASL